MHGGPKTVYKNAQHEKAMKAPINPKDVENPEDLATRLREKGLI
jgi:hypothetical protein